MGKKRDREKFVEGLICGLEIAENVSDFLIGQNREFALRNIERMRRKVLEDHGVTDINLYEK